MQTSIFNNPDPGFKIRTEEVSSLEHQKAGRAHAILKDLGAEGIEYDDWLNPNISHTARAKEFDAKDEGLRKNYAAMFESEDQRIGMSGYGHCFGYIIQKTRSREGMPPPLVFQSENALVTIVFGAYGFPAVAITPMGSGAADLLKHIGTTLKKEGITLGVMKVYADERKLLWSKFESIPPEHVPRSIDDIYPETSVHIDYYRKRRDIRKSIVEAVKPQPLDSLELSLPLGIGVEAFEGLRGSSKAALNPDNRLQREHRELQEHDMTLETVLGAELISAKDEILELVRRSSYPSAHLAIAQNLECLREPIGIFLRSRDETLIGCTIAEKLSDGGYAQILQLRRNEVSSSPLSVQQGVQCTTSETSFSRVMTDKLIEATHEHGGKTLNLGGTESGSLYEFKKSFAGTETQKPVTMKYRGDECTTADQ